MTVTLSNEDASQIKNLNVREYHPRKALRMKTNEDVIKKLLCISDLVISKNEDKANS